MNGEVTDAIDRLNRTLVEVAVRLGELCAETKRAADGIDALHAQLLALRDESLVEPDQ